MFILKKNILLLLTALGLLGFLRTVRDVARLGYGLLVFKLTGATSKTAFHSMRALFCRTGGRSNDFLHELIAKSRPPLPIQHRGVLGKLQQEQLVIIKNQLDMRGYYVFENRLSEDLCDRLLKWAVTEKATVKIDGRDHFLIYDRANPSAVRYQWAESDILKCPAAQVLMADPSILAISQAYLGCKPIMDMVAGWWHTSFSKLPDRDAAQFFHFDMDRIKWLKFFFYITDVETNSGPHTFIAGSHRTGGIPKAILDKGPVRIDDAEVMKYYSEEDIIEFCGPRGTVIAEDTRGLHKGKHVHAGDRLIFQIEFCSSLFGWQYPDPKGAAIGSELSMMNRSYPGIYDRYI